MKKPLPSRAIAYGFAFACFVIAWIGLAAYWSTHQLVRSFDSVSESHQAIEKLQSLQELMEAGEASVYSYVITGQPDRLVTYRHANETIPQKLRDLTTLLPGHPRQKKALRQFRQFLSIHQKYLEKIVSERQTHGPEAAADWVLAEDQMSIREAMDLFLAEIQKEESTVLKERSTSTTEHSSQTKAVLAGAAGISVALVACLFGLLRRETGERRVVENTNQRLETFLRSIVERIPYMVLVKEATHLRIILVNKAAAEWMGTSEQDLLGSNDFDLRSRDAAQQAMQHDREALQKGELVDIAEEPLIRVGQEERILHTQKIAIPDETGAPAYLLIISEDITQRKQAERMLELSRDTAVQSERLKSEFIRNMSHEIRTPLSVVIGMNALLLDTALTPEQRLFAAKVQRASEGLARLTKDILDFSKIEAGTFALEIQEMNLRQNVEGVVAMLTEQAKTKGVGLVSLIPNTIPSTLLGDPVRLRQVLAQLIGNALKFTPRGEVIIRVNEVRQTDDQLWLMIKVSDTGLGIPAEAQKYLFEPFRQGDGSRTRRFGGTGLGLAMSRRIVELMGGEIGFESLVDEGSTFWCTIPFKKRTVQGPVVNVTSLPWTRARVLVVDDNEVSRQMIRQQLSSWALASEGASSGERALELLRSEQKAGRPFPIVLLDMHLADMDSVALARVLKADPTLAGTLLVVLTGTPLDSSTLTSLGFAAWVPKPLQAQVLYDRLAGLIISPDKAHQPAA